MSNLLLVLPWALKLTKMTKGKLTYALTATLMLLSISVPYWSHAQCSGNAYLNASGINIEYDNFVSTFHSSLARQEDGRVLIWGEDAGKNGTSDISTPAELNNTNYGITGGSILKFTAGSSSINTVQFAALTADGLFVWGAEGALVDASLTSGTSVKKIFTAAQLPVAPANVKMLFGTYQTMVIVSSSNEVYVLSQNRAMRGNNLTGSTTWQQVQFDLNGDGDANDNGEGNITDVDVVRGCPGGLMALKTNGEVWTWGLNVYLNNGSGASEIRIPRKMTLPAFQSGSAKMIGMTGTTGTTAHYILGTDGYIYSLGDNSKRQLGNYTGTSSSSWVRVKTGNGANAFLGNIVWISPNEHDNAGQFSVNALTSDGAIWSWGGNERNMLGKSGAGNIDPYSPPGGLSGSDKVIAVETGGHTSVVIKKCEPYFGYVGHRINGSMGNGTASEAYVDTYSFGTYTLNLCSAPSGAAVLQPTPGAPYHINSPINLQPAPLGGTYTVTGPATRSGSQLTVTGNGKVTVVYSVPGTCKDNTFVIEAAQVLPAIFGEVSATIKGGRLLVNWSTETETNNSHFEIEASADGNSFTKIGELASKAPGGTSSLSLQYEFSKTIPAGGVAAIWMVAVGAMAAGLGRRRKFLMILGMAAVLVGGFAACQKNNSDTSSLEYEGKAFIRVAQVDIDGTRSYSKVVQAVNN